MVVEVLDRSTEELLQVDGTVVARLVSEIGEGVWHESTDPYFGDSSLFKHCGCSGSISSRRKE